jgi:hypothetical protein
VIEVSVSACRIAHFPSSVSAPVASSVEVDDATTGADG